MRGDRPLLQPCILRRVLFTPHARGSTDADACQCVYDTVYPACAGIDLEDRIRKDLGDSLPRMRGDRPRRVTIIVCGNWFTPHARGSTFQEGDPLEILHVYPACAGIDLQLCGTPLSCSRLPRMRGDRPIVISPLY